jgi:hypothetical protein
MQGDKLCCPHQTINKAYSIHLQQLTFPPFASQCWSEKARIRCTKMSASKQARAIVNPSVEKFETIADRMVSLNFEIDSILCKVYYMLGAHAHFYSKFTVTAWILKWLERRIRKTIWRKTPVNKRSMNSRELRLGSHCTPMSIIWRCWARLLNEERVTALIRQGVNPATITQVNPTPCATGLKVCISACGSFFDYPGNHSDGSLLNCCFGTECGL